MPTVTLLYAGLLGLLGMGLAAACGRIRGETGITLGDGDDEALRLAMRRQSNFVEFVPLVLVLIALLEMNGVDAAAIHVLGSVFLVSRLCHALGFTVAHPQHLARTVGAVGSSLVLVVCSIWALVRAF